MKAPLPADEAGRLKALQRYEILDTPCEQEFDDITLLASYICGTPIALITLVDEKRQWFKSKVGLTGNETSRDIAFCAHGILQAEVFVVNDAQADERFANNPLVTGDPKIRFYAGAPLITPDGHALGMLCVTDQVPRELGTEQKTALAALSRQVVAQLELRRSVAELKATQAELVWKTAFLEAQVNSSMDGTLVVDPQGKKILQNERLNDLLKIPRHIAEDKDDEKQVRWVTDMMKEPGPFSEKVVHLYSHPDEISRDEIEMKNGTILDRYSSPVTGKDGKHYGRIWKFRDITERKRVENVLRESEARFAGAFEFAPIGMALVAPEGRWLKVNRAVCQLVGYSEAELLAATFQEITHPDDLAADLECVRRLLAGEIRFYEMEKRYIHARGHFVTVLLDVSLVRDTQGQPLYFISQIQDITERKRTASALLESQCFLRATLDALTSHIAILDERGTIIEVNAAWNHVASENDFPASNGVGNNYLKVCDSAADNFSKEAPTVAAGIRAVIAGQREEFQLEYPCHSPQEKRWFLVRVTRFGGDGPVRVVVAHENITDRKKLETQLVQSQKMETVGKLAGGIAHEFNSILTAIIGQSELLLADLPAQSPFAKNATEIITAANRAAILTRQLLAYGRKQFLQPEILDLNQLVSGMADMIQNLMGVGVDTQIVPAADLPTVKADVGQIEQVIINLAINARDAMPNGGKLTLETANVSLDAESVERYPELKPGNYVMLAFTDTGMGMNDAVKARVFEPFFSTKGVGEGTGLGLSTCYGIIKQSGGHISVYSELGRGTTFKIYLPQVAAPATISIPRLDAPDLPRGRETILLVEDNPALREMAATLLRRLGYTVFAAANGVEALSLRHERGTDHIDLLFTDVVMPHMSGKELADQVRALYPLTKILFTSAYTENAIVHQGVLNKGVALLQKPFTPSALAKKVREALDQTNISKPADAPENF